MLAFRSYAALSLDRVKDGGSASMRTHIYSRHQRCSFIDQVAPEVPAWLSRLARNCVKAERTPCGKVIRTMNLNDEVNLTRLGGLMSFLADAFADGYVCR